MYVTFYSTISDDDQDDPNKCDNCTNGTIFCEHGSDFQCDDIDDCNLIQRCCVCGEYHDVRETRWRDTDYGAICPSCEDMTDWDALDDDEKQMNIEFNQNGGTL